MLIGKRILLLTFLCFPSYTFAQISIRGILLDAESREVLVGATISNSKDSLVAITNEAGRFELVLPEPDSLIFRYVGYAAKRLGFLQDAFDIQVTLSLSDDILDEVKVFAYEAGRTISEVAGGIGLIQPKDIQQFDQFSMVPILNQVPGVKMEQRSTGSYRISIRGSALRAPFDVRNIKVYWNNIPITEPGGNTPFNLLDNANFAKIEVIKGPSSSLYGAGIGGVVDIKSTAPAMGEQYMSAHWSMGSFGSQKYTVNANVGGLDKAINVTYSRQVQEGYRDHSALDRTNVGISAQFNTGDVGSINANILYSDLFYEIPGGLTEEQMKENPRQARPGTSFVLGSEEANASIKVKNLLLGLNYDTKLGARGNLLGTVYTNTADFENPFNLDYKREAQQSYGGRLRINREGSIGQVPTKLTVGGEYQFRFAGAGNYGNNYGQVDTLNFYDELRSSQYMLFGQYELFLTQEWILTLGLSMNGVQYDIFRTMDSQGEPGRVKRNFDKEWMPRIALVKSYDNVAFHGSISYGFSPPTLEEVRTNEGSINTDLEPEEGVNYEIGVRGNGVNKKFSYDITAFYLRLSESIVDYPSDRGTDLFRNTGSANLQGLEAAAGYMFINSPFSFVSRLSLHGNYAYHHFRFDEYVQAADDYSGNKFTGVSPHTAWGRVLIETASGFYVNIHYNYTDKIPLNDANTVYASSYQLLMAKLGFRKGIGRHFIVDAHIGGDNLLDQSYSLGNDLNAFGGRFYQPAPSRTYYGGLSLSYDW